jgi:hypothetical protein
MLSDRRNRLYVLLLGAAMFVPGCGGPSQFVFTMTTDQGQVESFVAVTSDADVIARAREELKRPAYERHLYILGRVAEGDGDHNDDWGWHFVAGEWELTDTSMDLCDGDPQFVEDAIRDWVQKIGRYCPKGARLVEER